MSENTAKRSFDVETEYRKKLFCFSINDILSFAEEVYDVDLSVCEIACILGSIWLSFNIASLAFATCITSSTSHTGPSEDWRLPTPSAY